MKNQVKRFWHYMRSPWFVLTLAPLSLAATLAGVLGLIPLLSILVVMPPLLIPFAMTQCRVKPWLLAGISLLSLVMLVAGSTFLLTFAHNLLFFALLFYPDEPPKPPQERRGDLVKKSQLKWSPAL